MSNIHQSENSYVIDQESAAEMARLLHQDQFVTGHMGGLFPPDLDLSKIHNILDVGSGPGGWVQDVAFAYRDKQIIGVDISNSMLNYAKSQINLQRLTNASFLYMDATSPLDFPDHSFDMVNARFTAGFLWREAWPQVVAEFVRVTRPGGIIRLTEVDNAGITNSAGYEKMNNYLFKAFHRSGRSFHPDEDKGSLALTPMLSRFLKQAGCSSIREQPYCINFSFGADGHDNMCKDMRAALKLTHPFVVKMKVASQEAVELAYQQMLDDIDKEEFSAIWYLLSAYGQKPA